jgi:lipopolysaccharide/colanic/teichoic acid biosynthesis glycosyltransferase
LDADPSIPARLRAKYAVDRILAPAVMAALAPLMGAIAVAIKLDDGGKVFFRQDRVGEHGKTFRIWKFRTMVWNAWEVGQGYVPEGTNLITRVGRFLRKTSLDELPQIFNILAGEMSFVGPRPTLAEQVERYTPEQRRRLTVRPGVTGWAQVHGRNTLPWSQRIKYDLEYVEKASLLFDLQVIAQTLPMVLKGQGVRSDQTRSQVDDLVADHARGQGP